MGQCNRCTMQNIRERAKKNEQKVTTIGAGPPLGGVNVYVAPPGVNVHKLSEKRRESHFCAWFMAIGSFCECD